MPKYSQIIICAVIIFIAILLLFSPTLKYPFCSWDDYDYVCENKLVQSLSFQNIKQYTIKPHLSVWAPLTFLSFSIDYHFFKLNPFYYHLENTVWHAFNTILLFILFILIFQIYCKQNKKSLLNKAPPLLIGCIGVLIALLWGAHPLRVESVTWITERKDVLCGFFVLLTYIFYLLRRYPLAFSFFFFAILSKPMAVTAPVILILIDIFLFKKWPLSKKDCLIKLPFFLTSALAAYQALILHSYRIPDSTRALLFLEKIISSVMAIGFYLVKTIAPSNLCAFYPNSLFLKPSKVTLFAFIFILFLFIAISIYVWIKKQTPGIMFAFLYFFITIGPVLPYFVVGQQVVADRFTYLPSIGLFILFGFICTFAFLSIKNISRFSVARKLLLIILICLLLIFYATTTIQLSKTWKTPVSIWYRVLELYPKQSVFAASIIGNHLIKKGRIENNSNRIALGKSLIKETSQIDPSNYAGILIRQRALNDLDNPQLLIQKYQMLIQKNPSDFYYSKLGNIYFYLKKYQEALDCYQQAYHLKPNSAITNYNLGCYYQKMNQQEKAISFYEKALSIDPKLWQAHNSLTTLFQIKGNKKKYRFHLKQARQYRPKGQKNP